MHHNEADRCICLKKFGDGATLWPGNRAVCIASEVDGAVSRTFHC